MKHTIKRILVPMDFSQISFGALRTAIAICKRQLATLTLLHVVENNYVVTHALHGVPFGNIQGELADIAKENLTKLAKDTRTEHDLVVTHVVQSGSPAEIIAMIAQDRRIDLIVMGTHGQSRFREFFMGSTTFRVIKTARCPVLSVPGHANAINFKKILFPVRFMANGLEKYEVLRPIIQKSKARLIIAGVMSRDEGTESKMESLVHSLKDVAKNDDVDFSTDVYYCDDIAKQVLALSIVETPDLLVITATLNSNWRELFPGTYVQQIVSHAKCPVLCIPPKYADSLSGELAITG